MTPARRPTRWNGRLAGGLCLLLALFPWPITHAADPDIIVIKNVNLIGPPSGAEDALVTIVVTNGKLDVVTKDEIAPETSTVIHTRNTRRKV